MKDIDCVLGLIEVSINGDAGQKGKVEPETLNECLSHLPQQTGDCSRSDTYCK